MKAAVYYDVRDIRYEEVPIPEIERDEVLLRMRSCGLCGTDIHKIIHRSVETPCVLGHEIAGEIVECGSRVNGLKRGDRVFVAHHVPCFSCRLCAQGHFTLCKQFKETNVVPGGFAEFVRVPGAHVRSTMLTLPEEIGFDDASMIEPLATVLHGFSFLNIRQMDRALIMGAGQIGALWIQVLKSMNVNWIAATDVSPFRLQKAKTLGADEAIEAGREDLSEVLKTLTKGEGVDIIVIAVGVPSLFPLALQCIRPGGQIMMFAVFPPHQQTAIDSSRICTEEISIVGSYSSMPTEYLPALRLIQAKLINTGEMITHRMHLAELRKAVDIATAKDSDSLKIIMHP